MKTPVVMINFKTYDQASGDDAVALAQFCKEVKQETKKEVIVCAQAYDISRCSKKITTFGQHVNTNPAGGHTGKLSIKALLQSGAKGCLVNHSENRIPPGQIMETIALLQQNRLTAVVCVKDVREARRVAQMKPDAIAIEPPELIGGDISVTTADPAIVSKSVEAVHKINPSIPVLCGAGVKNTKDVKAAIKLGAAGVLVASGVTKAKNQKKAVEQLVKGI